MATRIKWGGIKSPKRALEKIMRSYGGDASMILDLCRQMIIFDTVGELCEGLGVILSDPHVHVVRVKNKLALDYEGLDSPGYRDVSLNLRIHNATTLDLGLESHVCEVKLLLNDFHRIMVSLVNLPARNVSEFFHITVRLADDDMFVLVHDKSISSLHGKSRGRAIWHGKSHLCGAVLAALGVVFLLTDHLTGGFFIA